MRLRATLLGVSGRTRSVSDGVGSNTPSLTLRVRPARRGLSLIEVLLAMTIFLLALVAIARLVDMGTDREMDARFQTRATRLALSKLADFESGAESFSSTSGTFEGDDTDWQWQATIEDQGTPNLHVVKVTVTRDLKGRPFTLTLAQMMIDPAAMGGAGEATRPSGGMSP